jgi:hypothetical protein
MEAAKRDLVSLEALLLDMLEMNKGIPSWGFVQDLSNGEERKERGGAGEGGGVVLKAWGRGKKHSQQTPYKGVCSLCIGNISKKSQKTSYNRLPIWFPKH